MAEKIRKAVDEHKFDQDLHVTVRIGVDEYQSGTWQDLFTEVDQYLYKAKLQGGNCVCHPDI